MGNRLARLIEHPQHRFRRQVLLQTVVQRTTLAQFRNEQIFRPLGGCILSTIDEGRRYELDDVRVAGDLLEGVDLPDDVVAFFLVRSEQPLQGVLVPGLDVLCDENEREATWGRVFCEVSKECIVASD